MSKNSCIYIYKSLYIKSYTCICLYIYFDIAQRRMFKYLEKKNFIEKLLPACYNVDMEIYLFGRFTQYQFFYDG